MVADAAVVARLWKRANGRLHQGFGLTREILMRIAYLLNTYPTTSQTFIRREIQALELQSLHVRRYAIRRWTEPLIEDEDWKEQARTRYILSDRTFPLLVHLFLEIFTNPVGVARATYQLSRLIRNAGGDLTKHAAYFLEAATLRRWAAKDNIDFIHTHYLTNAATVAMLCYSMGGPPFSITVHGPEDFNDAKLQSHAGKLTAARFIVSISNFTRAQVARLGGTSWDRLHVVRCGIDTDEYSLSNEPFAENFTFVSVGRLCLDKAQELTVEAMSIVTKRYPNARLLLIGDGETRLTVEAAIAKHNLEDHVTILGWRNNSDVRRHVGSARALVLASLAEGLPIVIMEALALGRPVISTYIAGVPELVDRDCGWLVPAGSAEQISLAMIEAIEAAPERLAAMGQTGRKRVLSAHNIHKNAMQLRRLLLNRHAADATPTSADD